MSARRGLSTTLLVAVGVGGLAGAAVTLAVVALVDGSDWGVVAASIVVLALAVGALALLLLAKVVRAQGARVATLDRRIEKTIAKGAEQQKVLAALERRLKQPGGLDRGSVDEIEKRERRAMRVEFRQLEALMQLNAVVPLTEPMPPSRGWASSPDVLLTLVDLVREQRPRLVLDLGSGISTVYLAAALRAVDAPGRVVSIDHDVRFAEQTRRLLERQGLADRADVRVAELRAVELEGESWPWYALEAFSDLQDVDLLFIDGPPATSRPEARYPALVVLADRLRSDAVVVLDDYNRPDERTLVDRWTEADPTWSVTALKHEKGAAVLRRSPKE